MSENRIDFNGMSEYFVQSERTLRRWETKKPAKFEVMLNEYTREVQSKNLVEKSDSNIVLVSNLKGGTGKSTISDAIAFYLGESVILNLDIAQSATNFNANKTYNYIEYMDKYSVSQVVEYLKTKYRTVVIDTPGHYTQELEDALLLSDKFIIPMTVGGRSINATMSTLETFFGEDSMLSGNKDIYFFFNRLDDSNMSKSYKNSIDDFKKLYSEFTPSENINITSSLGSLGESKAYATTEQKQMSMIQLFKKNPNSYKVPKQKLMNLCKSIENKLEL